MPEGVEGDRENKEGKNMRFSIPILENPAFGMLSG
jgi:hypothetical protein